MNGPCPAGEELIALLEPPARGAGAEARRALRAHLASCAACREELAALEAGFAAMDPFLAPPPDPAALGRVEQAVLAETAHESGARAVAPARPGLGRHLGGALVTLACFALVLAAWRVALRHETHAPVAGACVAVLGALSLLGQRLGRPWQTAALLGGLAAMTALAVAASGEIDVPLLRGATCLVLLLSGALLPAASLWWFCGPARRTAVGGALLGAAIFSGGVALQVALCPLGLAHAAVFHVGPLLLGTTALGLLGWRAARSRAAA